MQTVPRIVASIEARMSASRLPGKVLMDVAGEPALERLVRRLEQARTLDAIVLATTINPADDPIAAWAAERRLPCYRGSEEDVLDRVVNAHRMMASDIVVEICGDAPLLDPRVIDQAVAKFNEGEFDVVSTTQCLTWPQGIDAQVFRLDDLASVAETQTPELRLQMDYPEDLALIRTIYDRLSPQYGDAFGVPEILSLLTAEPALREINRHCEEKPVR